MEKEARWGEIWKRYRDRIKEEHRIWKAIPAGRRLFPRWPGPSRATIAQYEKEFLEEVVRLESNPR